jgi:1-acyl-sn-glycerol-3-phosphate acyltransferase
MGALSFVYLICLINPLQMLSLVILPFSRAAFRKFNCTCAAHIWGIWVWQARHIVRIELRYTGDDLPVGENAVVVSNHQSMADIMVLLFVAHRCQRLPDLKFFVKDMMRYIPGPGWGMLFIDCIFVKRNWNRDRAGIEALFSKFMAEQIPIFLVSFLDGTRLKPKKLKRAQEFARERGLYVPQHSHLDAVYDLTLAYERKPVPSLVDCFAVRVQIIDIHVQRIPMDELPIGDEAALEAWVQASYRAKDERLAAHAQHGVFRD